MKNNIAIVLGAVALCCHALAEDDRGRKLLRQSTSVEGCSPSECDSVDGNLVANCGFETGDFTDWSLSGDTSHTGVAPGGHSGCFSAYFGPTNGLGFAAQDLPTAVGEYYDLSFWLRGTGQPNRFQVLWCGELVYECVNCPDFQLEQFSVNGLIATNESTELKFGFYNPPDVFSFDDVVVTVSKAPNAAPSATK